VSGVCPACDRGALDAAAAIAAELDSPVVTHAALERRLADLEGDVMKALQRTSALWHWADSDAAPKIRRFDEVGCEMQQYHDKARQLDQRMDANVSLREALEERLAALAAVAHGRLEAIEGVLAEWNGWAHRFADRLDTLEARVGRLEKRERER
jgi:hypothetical protein